MDIRMPGINGIEAAKKILSQKPESNIIAVTATNEYIDREKCLNAGMKGFLLKPFSEKELFEIIRLTLNPGPGNFQKVTKPKVSLEDAKRLANGDEAFLKEMSQLFLESTQKGLSEIKKSLVKKNHDNIAEACHKMAAPCKHFRANDLYATIKQLESQAKNQDDWDSIISQVKLLETEIEEIKKIFDSTLIM